MNREPVCSPFPKNFGIIQTLPDLYNKVSFDKLRMTELIEGHHINYFLGAFFLPATVLRLPLRVRLFVRVRWPRTGKPLRWRRPR